MILIIVHSLISFFYIKNPTIMGLLQHILKPDYFLSKCFYTSPFTTDTALAPVFSFKPYTLLL